MSSFGQKVLAQLSKELAEVLQKNFNLCGLVSHFDTEIPPENIDLLTHQHEKDVSSQPFSQPTSQSQTSPKTKKKQNEEGKVGLRNEWFQYKKRDTSHLSANANCNLCPSRIYPVYKYLRTGKLPILVLYYNAPLQPGTIHRDRSKTHILGGDKEDELWGRMLAKLNLSVEDLYYQEFLACHFNASRSADHDWEKRSQHCQQHLFDTIKKYNISRLILCGNAALLLLGKKEAGAYAKSAQVFEFIIQDRKLECIVLRSPLALLTIENQRKQELSQTNKEAEKYQKLVAQEKEIKSSILAALQTLLGKVV